MLIGSFYGRYVTIAGIPDDWPDQRAQRYMATRHQPRRTTTTPVNDTDRREP
jgi:hypothetical protein